MAVEESASSSSLAAKEAGLHRVTGGEPGYRRRRRGGGFSYLREDGSSVSDPAERRRIQALAIPPAWSDVWICALPEGHIQATGRDEAGRKQYIYHPDFTAARDAAKYAALADFGHALPRLRRRVRRDLRRGALDQRRLTAAAVRLLDLTLIRVGNVSYARDNGSFGLTTLRRRHLRLEGGQIAISFRGKSGERQAFSLLDEELAEVFRQCQEIPGYELFHYLDEAGERHLVDSQTVNDYLRNAMGAEVSAKEFRTWGGTVVTAEALASSDLPADADERVRRAAAAQAVEVAAAALGNTPAVCRQSYVHPRVLNAFIAGTFQREYALALSHARRARTSELRLHEAATLAFLEAA